MGYYILIFSSLMDADSKRKLRSKPSKSQVLVKKKRRGGGTQNNIELCCRAMKTMSGGQSISESIGIKLFTSAAS